MNKDFHQELLMIWQKVVRKEPLALVRYADGELLFLEGKRGYGIDGWLAPSYLTRLGRDLRQTLHHREPNYYYGIPCDCCDLPGKKKLLSILSQDFQFITFSNLFVNANYSAFQQMLSELEEEVVLIANQAAIGKDLSPLKVKELVPVGNDCVSFWEQESDTLKVELDRLAGFSETLFLVSAGPISELIIDYLWNKNKTNRYLDVGSALDPLIHQCLTRPYQLASSEYASRVCVLTNEPEPLIRKAIKGTQEFSQILERLHYSSFEENGKGEITVIINGYQRPENISKIYHTVQNQTVKPKAIMLWYNDFERNQGNREISDLCISALTNYNFGVWARFAFALNAKTEYICIFDDDTIPGDRWFENCLQTMATHEGLLGTVGLIFGSHLYMNHDRYGWPNPNREVKQVDLVGHCWFFKREWLSAYWRDLPPNGFEFVGEDMHFSYAIQKYLGLNTYVPPHPPEDKRMWGSIEGYNLGVDEVAISVTNKDNFDKKLQLYLTWLIHKGWQPICSFLYELKLRYLNFIVFPNWNQAEEDLYQDLSNIVRSLINHPDLHLFTLLIDTSNTTEEQASLAISYIMMNLLIVENLELEKEPEVSFLGNLSPEEWEIFISRCVMYRISFPNENEGAIAQAKAGKVPIINLVTFNQQRAYQTETGFWEFK